MRSRNSTLIRELLSLYVKYGPGAFEAAARELREGNVTEAIAEAAERLEDATRRPKVGRTEKEHSQSVRRSKHELLSEYISYVRRTGHSADIEITDLITKIVDRSILRTPTALREYMASIGVPIGGRNGDRYDEARRILEFLKTLPEHELRGRIEAAAQIGEEESSLQRWTNIIVKPNR